MCQMMEAAIVKTRAEAGGRPLLNMGRQEILSPIVSLMPSSYTARTLNFHTVLVPRPILSSPSFIFSTSFSSAEFPMNSQRIEYAYFPDHTKNSARGSL